MIAVFALYSAGKDVKEIYDTKNVLNNLQNNLAKFDAKPLLDNEKIKPFINTHNESDDKNKIDEKTIDSFVTHFVNNSTEGNDKLQENFQKIVNHYQKNPISAASLGKTLRDIYNKNCEKGKELGFFDLKALEDPIGLFNNLKNASKDKFIGLVASIANNPQIIDDFANPSKINKLMEECKENNGDIDVIKNTIEEKLKPVASKDSQQNNNEKAINIKALLLSETKINQTQYDNSQIPDAKKNDRQM